MKSTLLLAALWALIPSATSAVVYSDEIRALSISRVRHAARGVISQERDVEHLSNFRTRSAPQTIGSFDLAGTISPGLVLNINDATSLPSGVKVGSSISANCGSCFTTGKGVVTTNGVSFDDSVFKNPITAAEEFFKDPVSLIQNSFDVEMDFDLSNFTGHFEFDMTFSGTGTYDISIPLPDTPVGGSFPDPPLPAPAPGATVGLVPTIDVIFSVTGTVSMSMGFEFNFPNDASFKIDPLKGHLISTNFGDVQFKPLPVKFKSGSGTATAQLKLGAKLAFDFKAFGQGFTLESGIFSDVPTYSAAITFTPDAACEVAFAEHLAVDAGVFASAAATIDGANVGVGPKFVTTFATLSLPGGCLVSSTPAANQSVTAPSNYTITAARNYTTTAASNYSITALPGSAKSTPVAITSYFVPSSLATPLVGPYITGTPVISATQVGAIPTDA